jgi:hypothetical protein
MKSPLRRFGLDDTSNRLFDASDELLQRSATLRRRLGERETELKEMLATLRYYEELCASVRDA